VAQRLRSLEADVVGRAPGDLDAGAVAPHLSILSPIDDVRATAAYRLRAAAVLVRRALDDCGGAA
jgi:CO/xanthine dehydrogenase FAD-binding subunit